MSYVLTYLLLIPILGALAILFGINNDSERSNRLAKIIALFTAMSELLVAALMWLAFDSSIDELQFVEKFEWIEGYNIFYFLAVDAISMPFIVLTAFLIPICLLSSWYSIKVRVKEFLIFFLVMETCIMGVFCCFDFFLFYIFFEAVLIPMFFIIGIWGGKDRFYAAYKFFLYTLAGSVLLLLAIVYVYYRFGTSDIVAITKLAPTIEEVNIQRLLWLAMFASFAVKVPMWPVHTWLPDAHVQAPTAGSVILAGVLLKLGGYGIVRFLLTMLPDASLYFADMVMWMSIIAVIVTSLIALMQEDMKKMIAYSSVAHMGFVTAGLFSFNQQGIEGAIFQMISHGLVSGALFLCVGVVYDRMHTREIAYYGGLTTKMPKYALQFMLFMLASVGLPGTAGFVGEFMIMLGVFNFNKIYAALIATGMVLGAAYMLWLYARVMFGEVKNTALEKIKDLTTIEKVTLWPIAIMVVVLGIYPSIVLKDLHVSSKNIADIYVTISNSDAPAVVEEGEIEIITE